MSDSFGGVINSNVAKVDFEDIVIKASISVSSIGLKTLQILTEDMFNSLPNKEIISNIRQYYEEYKKFPKISELMNILLKTDDAKDKLNYIITVSLKDYTKDSLKDAIENFIKDRKIVIAMRRFLKNRQDGSDIGFDENLSIISEDVKTACGFKIQTVTNTSIKNDMDGLIAFLNRPNSHIPTFSEQLNEATNGGYLSGELNLWLGESNVGKTTMLCNDAAYAFMNGYNVIYFNLEMSKYRIMQKIISNVLNIKTNEINSMSPSFLSEKLEEVSKSDLMVLEYPQDATTVNDIRNYLEQLKRDYNTRPHIIFIDYLNCLTSSSAANGDYNKYLNVAVDLEMLSHDLDCPIVSACQLNRSGYNNKTPDGSSIGGSMGIFQKCGLAINMMRQMDENGNYIENLYSCLINKNRDGRCKYSFNIYGEPDYMRFRDGNNYSSAGITDTITGVSSQISGI